MADYLDISRQDGQPHIALKSFYSMVQAPIQTMVLKGVYAGLHCGMLPPGLTELFRVFNLPVNGREFSLSGKYDSI